MPTTETTLDTGIETTLDTASQAIATATDGLAAMMGLPESADADSVPASFTDVEDTAEEDADTDSDVEDDEDEADDADEEDDEEDEDDEAPTSETTEA